MKPHDYRERIYRRLLSPQGLLTFQVRVRETDLFIAAQADLSVPALNSVHLYRGHLENYIKVHPEFLTSLTPLPKDALAPEIVRNMIIASDIAGVGPMAAVAGAMAELVGRDLERHSLEVMVENGGDIYLNCKRELKIGIFAGESPLSNRLSLKIDPSKMPLGVCTSSGTVGPSRSFGRADAVCVLSRSAALADAAASQIGNVVKSKNDLGRAIGVGKEIPGVMGMVIIIEDQMTAWGDLELT
jgi:ApbE superfamily uncharacterized protein (UPF0280 family)